MALISLRWTDQQGGRSQSEDDRTYVTIVVIFAARTSKSDTMLNKRRMLRQMKSGPDGRGGRKGLMGSIGILLGEREGVVKEWFNEIYRRSATIAGFLNECRVEI